MYKLHAFIFRMTLLLLSKKSDDLWVFEIIHRALYTAFLQSLPDLLCHLLVCILKYDRIFIIQVKKHYICLSERIFEYICYHCEKFTIIALELTCLHPPNGNALLLLQKQNMPSTFLKQFAKNFFVIFMQSSLQFLLLVCIFRMV